ncbi:AMP-binding protein [Gordonia sp. (in: high G+C Gram-positive bacteria)]|uniref:AMP-binding protein n=1 Tax=Gordonia sp. (in: high G+C Gram-positive bacteria) TaxID=84139 RepID=UPI0039E6B801
MGSSPVTDDLTAAQHAVWFAQQQVGDAPVYQCVERIDITGPFDVDRFTRVLRDRLRRIPALNARYRDDGAGPHRIPDDRAHPIRLHLLDADGDPAAAAAALAEIIASTTAPRPIGTTLDGDLLSGHDLIRLTDRHHVWVPRIHHIAVDGYSFAALLRWTAECYSADLAGLPLPESPFSPPDPAGGDSNGEDAEFWAGYLDAARPASISRAEPSPAREPAYRHRVELAPRSGDGRRGWAESMMAALACYVGALSGEAVVTLGVPWAHRRWGGPVTMEPEVNILPLRLTVAPTMTVGELVDAVTRELAVVRPHIGHRADRLRRDLGLVGADSPLYGPCANIKFFTPELRFGEAAGTVSNISMGPVDDLTLTGSPRPDAGFLLEVEAAPARYTAEQARDHAERLGALLARIGAADAETPLGALPIALPREAELEIVERNRTDSPALRAEAESVTLATLLAEAAVVHADRPALAWGGTTLTYRELRAAVADLADTLAAHGVGRGDVVALRLERSPETVAGLLATLECGAAYLPIDPALPAERVVDMLDDARPRVLLTAPDDAAPADGTAYWRRDALALRIDPGPGPVPDTVVGRSSPRDAAYLIFTSGSTGRPKGVVVEHRSIVNRLRWMDEMFGLGPDDRVLQKTPYSFDVSVWEFFWPLISGATLVLATPGVERDSPELAREMVERAITVCHFVPSALAAYLAADPSAAGEHALRLVVCSGEALPPEVLRRGRELLPYASIHNLYGPTEAAVDVTEWAPGPDWDARAVPIGVPVPNTAAYVLDAGAAPAAARGDRRTVSGRDPARPRLPASSRPHRTTIRRRSVRAGPPDVRDRGSGAPRRHRCAAVRRPGRRPGEGARTPYRTGRDHRGARRPARDRPGRGGDPGGGDRDGDVDGHRRLRGPGR